MLARSSPWADRNRLAFAAALLAALLGVVVLIGWLTGQQALTSPGPGLVAMKPNVAISLLLLGGALALSQLAWLPGHLSGIALRNVLSLLVLAIALATILEYVLGQSLGIDQAFFREVPGVSTPFPGRPPLAVALALASASLGTLLLGRRWRGYHPSQVLAFFTASVGGLVFLGYAYGAQELVSLGANSRTSFAAAPGLLLLSLAILAANPRHGLMVQMTDPGPAGQVARRVGPAALLVVPIGALVRLEGEKAGLYDAQLGLAIMTVFEALVLLAVGAWASSRILSLETARAEASRDRDRFFELSSDLILVTDHSGRVLQLSASWEPAIGRPLQEMLGRSFVEFVHSDDQAETTRRFEDDVVRGSGVSGFQNRYVCADGSCRWLEWTATADATRSRVFAAARDVTEQKGAAETLREASLYARGLIEASLDPLVTISQEGKVTDVNRATEEVTGRGRDELIGTDFADYFTEPQQARAGYERVLRDGLVRDYPLTVRHVSGLTTDVVYNATVYRDEKGELQGVFAAARDVTEQRRAAATQARLATIVESSVDGIFATDFENRIEAWNPACEVIFGYSSAETLGRPAGMLAPEDSRAEQSRRYALARDGNPQVYEAFRRRKDGTTFRAQLCTFPMHSSDGAFLGLSTIVRDVSEAYEARERLRAYTDELARSNQELDRLLKERDEREAVLREQAGLLELAHDAIVVRGFDGVIRYWSAGAERTYGWSSAEATGKITHELLATVFPESLAALNQTLLEAGSWEGQLGHTTRDGREVVVESRQVLERDSQGRPTAILEINRDVTESVSAHRRLEESAEELRRSNAELEQFAYVASHDLQEPLRMVTGFVGLLQRRYSNQLDASADEFIGFAVEGAHRMQSLINDLLAYSRVGTRGHEFEPVDLNEVVEEALINLRVAIEESHARVEPENLPTVRADRRQMLQLMQNLIGNAVKFHGDEPPEVAIGARREPDGWRIFVRDNGIGMDAKYHDQVFVIFGRLHSREAYPGSGIGLAICKKIVERHGGRIWVESAPGKGSTFWLTLPDARRSLGGHT